MEIVSNKCPYCGASLVLPEDGRMSFFCSYCGTQIILEKYPGVEDLLRIKEADAKQKSAHAKELYAGAKYKNADVRHMREVDQIEGKKREKKGSLLFGILLTLFSLALAGMFTYFRTKGIIGRDMAHDTALGVSMFVYLFFAGVFLYGLGSISDAIANEPDYEKQLEEAKKKLEKLNKELEEQEHIVISCGNAFIGEKAKKKRFAKQKIKAIRQSIKETEQRIHMLS